MKNICLLAMLSLALGACASSGLEYKPAGDSSTPVSAVHQVTPERLFIEIASEGYRVEDVTLVLANGTEMKPETIHHPAPARQNVRPAIGVGVGGGVLGRNTAVGGGVGIDTSSGQYGNTVVVFPRSRVGDGPWTARIKLLGFAPVDIELPSLGTVQPDSEPSS